jgi:acyl carrier protein
MRRSTWTTVRELVAEVSGVDVAELNRDTDLFADLGVDSAKALELIVELEDAFNITIGGEDAADVSTLGQVVDLVTRLSKPKANVRRR